MTMILLYLLSLDILAEEALAQNNPLYFAPDELYIQNQEVAPADYEYGDLSYPATGLSWYTGDVLQSFPPIPYNNGFNNGSGDITARSTAGCDAVGTAKDACCTPSNKCNVGQGDCDSNNDCLPGLYCHQNLNNCRLWHPNALADSDCCMPSGTGCNGMDWNCCSSSRKCSVGEGDCDSDSDCQDGLVCAHDNCKQWNPLAPHDADCCIPEDIKLNKDNINNVKTRVGNVESNIKSIEGRLNSRVNTVDTKVGAAEKRLNTRVNTLDSRVNTVDSKVGTAENRLNKRVDSVESNVTTIENTLRKYVGNVTANLGTIKTDVAAIESNVEGIVSATGTLSSNLNTVETDVDNVEIRLNSLINIVATNMNKTNNCRHICGTARSGRSRDIIPDCPRLIVTGANYTFNGNDYSNDGEYKAVLAWSYQAPDHYVYKHVNKDSYIFYATKHGDGWRLGDSELNLKDGTFLHHSGLETPEPWQGTWVDNFPPHKNRPAPKVVCKESKLVKCLKCLLA